MTLIAFPAPTLADALQGVPLPVAPRRIETAEACPLAPGEITIVQCLADGLTRGEAAPLAGYRPKTLNTLMARVLTAVGARNTAHLVAITIRNGWIS